MKLAFSDVSTRATTVFSRVDLIAMWPVVCKNFNSPESFRIDIAARTHVDPTTMNHRIIKEISKLMDAQSGSSKQGFLVPEKLSELNKVG